MKVIGPFSPPHHSSFLLGACASHPYHPHVWGEWSFFSDKANSCNIEALLSAGDLVLVWLCFNSWSLLSDFLKRHYLFLTCSILCLLDLWNFSLVPGFETVTLFFLTQVCVLQLVSLSFMLPVIFLISKWFGWLGFLLALGKSINMTCMWLEKSGA